jgi:hypothetical protein
MSAADSIIVATIDNNLVPELLPDAPKPSDGSVVVAVDLDDVLSQTNQAVADCEHCYLFLKLLPGLLHSWCPLRFWFS